MRSEAEITVASQDQGFIESGYTPQEMAAQLAAMKARLDLTQAFFKQVMVKDQDYGVIPGTDKPTLLKSGAEKLCEFYGYAITIKDVQQEKDHETGYYRAVVTVALISRKNGSTVAEGVGEASTMEGRYRWRWLPEWKLPKNINKDSLLSEERVDKNGNKYRMYRVPNDDPWSLWNTVLKMAKKRALVDATLSATRSSGIFTQDEEDLQEWIAEEQKPVVPPPQSEPPKTPKVKIEDGISQSQREFILKLVGHFEKDPEKRPEWLKQRYGFDINQTSKADASKVIEQLQAAIAADKAARKEADKLEQPSLQ